MSEAKKPNVSSESEKELVKVAKQFEDFDQNVKNLTLDRMNLAPKADIEPQTKIAQSDLQKMKDVYLKPEKAISCRDKFNEEYREAYNFAKEYVHFIAENKEIIGETIKLWTRPFAGMPAEYWSIPCNKPIWGPRYLAEQIKRKFYHRLVMDENKTVGSDGRATYYGSMAVDTTIPRLDAHPVINQKSIFMGAKNF
jgi:hypothetical protein